MAYVIPTLAQFKTKFPEIVAADATIQAALDEAVNEVDTSWSETSYYNGILYFAAYLLTGGDFSTGASGGITSESFGPISVSYDAKTAGTLSSNSYGRRFAQLRRREKGGPRIAAETIF